MRESPPLAAIVERDPRLGLVAHVVGRGPNLGVGELEVLMEVVQAVQEIPKLSDEVYGQFYFCT